MALATQTQRVLIDRLSSGSGAPARVTFPLFTGGSVSSVRLDVTIRVAGSISAENLDLAPVTLNAGVGVGVGVQAKAVWYSRPPFSPIYAPFPVMDAAGSGGVTALLGAFDGTSDFSGASGISAVPFTGSTTTTATFAGAPGWLYGPSGDLELTVLPVLSSFLAAGGGLRLQSEASADVEIGITYDYTPTAPPTTTSGSVVTFLGGVPGIVISAAAGAVPTVTTPVQRFSFAQRTSGWSDTASVARFDAALGTLRSVNVRVATTMQGSASAEHHLPSGDVYRLTQTGSVSVSAPGGAGPLATAVTPGLWRDLVLGPADGIGDFAGSGGVQLAAERTFGSAVVKATAMDVLAAFTGSGTVSLPVASAGTSHLDALPDMLLETHSAADAVVEVSYTYEPAAPVTPLGMRNNSSGAQSEPTPVAYAGPIAGISQEFAAITPDSVSLWAATDGWYLRGGDGNDAIRANGGVNVVDGGRGSNFLTGGSGVDMFIVDTQWVPAPIWNTITNLQTGDSVTVWGITPGFHAMAWRDGQGAAGFEGLTLHARAPGGPSASVTLTGYSRADMEFGRLATAYGTADGVPYLHIAAH